MISLGCNNSLGQEWDQVIIWKKNEHGRWGFVEEYGSSNRSNGIIHPEMRIDVIYFHYVHGVHL